jgi:hypothetical protein
MTLTAITPAQFAAEQRPGAAWPEHEDGAQCVSNISPAEQRRRLTAGLIGLGLGLALFTVLLAIGADRLWRLALLPMFWGGMISVFQWRDKT